MPILEWVALLKDKEGKLHTFRQPSNDPPVGFKRVLEEEKKGNLIRFFLDLPEHKQSIGVDLKTGTFIFSSYFQYHPAPELAKMKLTYRLINFRRKYRDMEIGLGRASAFSEIILAYYILGWQTTVGIDSQYVGNHQRMMFIDPNTLEITFKEKR